MRIMTEKNAQMSDKPCFMKYKYLRSTNRQLASDWWCSWTWGVAAPDSLKSTCMTLLGVAGLKVNDQLVAYATRFLAVRLKNLVRSHHCALKAKV